MEWQNRIIGSDTVDPEQLLANPNNHRIHPYTQEQALEGVLNEVGWVQRVIVNKKTNFVVDGHLRVALAIKNGQPVPVEYVELNHEEEMKILALLDYITGMAGTDEIKLRDVVGMVQTDDEVLQKLLNDMLPAPNTGTPGALKNRFIVPPFTVLDAKQGYWLDRKRQWVETGIIANDTTRDHVLSSLESAHRVAGVDMATTSIFDPVLAEIVYRWFNVPSGAILDPFAGEAVKGAVAGFLGYPYTGVELRQEQVDINRTNWTQVEKPDGAVMPTWIQGDSAHLADLLPASGMYDLFFTSPPYYDLEIYSGSDKDGSAFADYEAFLAWLQGIYAAAYDRMNDNRFMVIKVGDIRDEQGVYRNFVSDSIKMMRACGALLYNEAILVTPIGTLTVRSGRQFSVSRKLGKAHQNVLVFYKGDPRGINEHYPEEVLHVDSDTEV